MGMARWAWAEMSCNTTEPETVVLFDRATRNCRLGDMIVPDSDLFLMQIKDRDSMVLYTNNAAP